MSKSGLHEGSQLSGVSVDLDRKTDEMQRASRDWIQEVLVAQHGLPWHARFNYGLTKLVVLDESGLEMKAKGGVMITGYWQAADGEQTSANFVMNDGMQPNNENVATWIGGWAEKLRWLGHAHYDTTQFDAARLGKAESGQDTQVPLQEERMNEAMAA